MATAPAVTAATAVKTRLRGRAATGGVAAVTAGAVAMSSSQ